MRKPTKTIVAVLVSTSLATLSARDATGAIVKEAAHTSPAAAQTGGGKSGIRKVFTPRSFVILGGVAVLIGAIVGVSRSGDGRNAAPFQLKPDPTAR
jgi:hypothetical protein